ncbi:MAG: hypothetical protein M0Q15_18045 [Nevskia sp.]|jgi:hypothetical protein|nr:hypothetical protein [Nevskia sp.]
MNIEPSDTTRIPAQSTPADGGEDALIAQLHAQLRAQEQTLDYTTTTRLRAARARAVAAAAARKPAFAWPWAAVAPLACAALVAGWVVVPKWLATSALPNSPVSTAQLEVVDLLDTLELLSAEEPALPDDNLDFALWLEATRNDT